MSELPVRVMVLDTWDEIPLAVSPELPIVELKRRALVAAKVRRPAERYEVKFRGAVVPEGDSTVAEVGLVPNSQLIVLPSRRRPAR
ncbi:MAG: hypothetical protein AB7R55_15935 [Gemmatimonadales bacterium]